MVAKGNRRSISLDAGNGDIKVFNGVNYTHFRHAIATITDSEWARITNHGKSLPDAGYISVNGSPFAIGDKARMYQIKSRPAGAQRYTSEYYGVLMCGALVEAYPKAETNRIERVDLFATHAPADFDYAIDLENSAKGRWDVVSYRGETTFVIDSVSTVDEPLAGVYHYALTPQYTSRKGNPLPNLTFIVLDVGAHTADTAIFDAGYSLDQQSIGSTRIGMRTVYERFEADLRSANHATFKDVQDIDSRRIENALLNGVFSYGKQSIDCKSLAQQHMQILVNDCVEILKTKSGGMVNVDAVVITGGGGGLLLPYLQKELSKVEFLPVETDTAKIRYSNAVGAYKFFKMMEKQNA